MATAASGGALQLDSIPVVDLRLLSQSEIYALSICSSSAFDPDRCSDVVIPKIDRSVFNESAGSRKQTYSRLRLAPPSSSPSATLRRTPHLRRSSVSLVNTDSNNSGPGTGENAQILPLFKKLFASDINLGESFPIEVDHSHSLLPHQLPITSDQVPAENLGDRKRKREDVDENEPLPDQIQEAMGSSVVDVNGNVEVGNEPLPNQIQAATGSSVVDVNGNVEGVSLHEVVVRENLEDRDKGILNRDGVTVDVVALGLVDHPYAEEIRRRTEGLETVEELKVFLGGLKGRWGSSRKKRRIVDASEFGSALPIGWKLLVSVEKKNGRTWLCCACYISPSGRQFVSCKEASSYLVTLTGVQDTSPSTYAQRNETSDDKLTSIRVKIADTAIQDVGSTEIPSSHGPLPAFASTTSNHVSQVISDAGLLSKELLEEVLHCDKCNVTFCRKDDFLHNQSSIHQRNGYKNVVRFTNGSIFNENNRFNEASNFHDETHDVINSAPEKSIYNENKRFNEVPNFHDETHDVINSAPEKSASIKKPKQNVESESYFSAKQPSNLEDFPCNIVDTVDKPSISASMGSESNLQSNISELASSCDEKAHAEENVPCSISEYMVDEKRSFEGDDHSPCMHDEMQCGVDSVISSWNEKESIPGVQNTSKSSLAAFSGLKGDSGADNNDDELCGRKMGVLEFDGIKIDSFINNQIHLEQERLFGIDCDDSSFNNRTHELGTSFSMFCQGMDTSVPRGDSMLSSGQNFMIGFGDSSGQSGDFIRNDGSLRTGHENLFQGCFDPVPNAQVQSASHFRNFDLTSEKAKEGSSGVSKNPDIRTGNLRPGRNEPVEYSFMGEQSSNSPPGGSKIFSHNATIEQGLVEPSFWLGKDALMPNTIDINQGTSVCVWCQRLFYEEQLVQTQHGVQTGAIGSLCPSCSTRIPGQF